MGSTPKPVVARSGAVAVRDTADAVRLSAGNASLTIDRKTGLVDGYARGGTVLATGGAPHFWRAETDNDTANGVVALVAPWKGFNDERQVRSIAVDLLQATGLTRQEATEALPPLHSDRKGDRP